MLSRCCHLLLCAVNSRRDVSHAFYDLLSHLWLYGFTLRNMGRAASTSHFIILFSISEFPPLAFAAPFLLATFSRRRRVALLWAPATCAQWCVVPVSNSAHSHTTTTVGNHLVSEDVLLHLSRPGRSN